MQLILAFIYILDICLTKITAMSSRNENNHLQPPRGLYHPRSNPNLGPNDNHKEGLMAFHSHDRLDGYSGHPASSSHVSTASSTAYPKDSGVSVVTPTGVVNTNNSRETTGPPDAKRYFSLRPARGPPFIALEVMQNNVKPRQHFLESLKFRFGGVKKPSRSRETGVLSHETSHPADEKSFEKICFELACVDHCEVGSEKIAQMFELQELNIKMAVLSEGFRIVLPPYLDLPGLGDIEEQGVGGTCDQFIGSLPPSCRKVSEKASPLGLVPKLLPHGLISKGARYVGSCFWIWLCIVDGNCTFGRMGVGGY